MEDACVLFKTTFTYETETEHVEEIQFEHPVYLTAFLVDSVHGSIPRFRLYARDVLCLSGSRFVPLFDGIIPQSSNPLQIPKTVSDRVILRMDAKEFRLAVYGRNYVHPVKEVELPKTPMLTLPPRDIHSIPYQAPHRLPYLDGFPRELNSVINGLGRDGEVTKQVHGVVFQAADELCRKLGIIAPGAAGSDLMEESLEPLGDPLDLASLAKKVVKWMDGMTSLTGSTGRNSGTIEEGMLSLGLSVVLCSCRSTVLHFISAGGLASLIGIFQLRGATALMMRYLVCSVELISIVGGVVGSDALLGNWRYPPEFKQVQKSTGMIHVPGIINAKLRKDDISPPSLPPGMIRSKKSNLELDSENQRIKSDDPSKRKSSSRSKKEKRRKSKHKTSEKSSTHGSVSRHYNETKREDRETKRHRHRRSTSDQKQANDDSNKRQKLGHPPPPPPSTNTSCIDLETQEGLIKNQSMYEILFDIAFQPRPKGIIDSVKRVLDRLNLFNCLSDLQKTSTKLRELVIEADGKELELNFSQLTPLLSCVDPCVAQIFDFMKDSIQKTNIDNNNNNDDNQNNKGFWSVQELDESFLESISGLESFQDLDLVIKILCLPFSSLKNSEIGKSEFLELKSSILLNTGSLLSLILACPNGLPFLNHQQDQITSMEKTGRLKDSPGDDLTTVQVKKDFQSRLSFIRKAQDCQQVIEKIIKEDLESQELNSAFQWIAEFFRNDENQTEALSFAIQACPEFLLKLSQVMEHQTQKLASLTIEDDADSMKINRRIPVHVVPIIQLLNELTDLCWSPGILTGFLKYSKELQEAVEKEQELKEKALISHQDQQSLSRNLLSQLEVCRSYSATGWSGILTDLTSIFSSLNSQEDAIGLFKNDAQFGRVLMSCQILISVMNSVPQESLMASIYGSNLLPTLVKALKTAILILKAGNADFMAAAMTGEFKNDLSLNRSIQGSLKYLLRVLQTILSTSKALQRAKIDLKSTGCLESLIEAYFQLALMSDSMLEILQKRVQNSEVLKCKTVISEILLIWLESNWMPSVLDSIFAQNHTVNECFSRPSRIFSNCCLLNDLFPEEWPPLPHQTQQRGFLTPPSRMKTRALLARGLECHNRAFKFLIEYGLGSESHIVRCVVVKLCAKAAGLGGGMGVFLVEPIMQELTSLIKNSGTPSDYYRLVEIISGLVHWPAIKAAFLDSKLVSSISRLLHSLAPECEKDGSLLAICSAFLDVFRSLMDPGIALDPLEAEDKRLQLDCPGSSELGVMVAALLANLSQFHSLEGKVLELLKSTEILPEGRSILMRGISRWRIAYTNTTTEIQDEILLQWAQEQLKKTHDSKAEHPCGQILEFLASLTGACSNNPSREAPSINERPSAPARFKDLVQRTQDRSLLTAKNTESEESGKLFWKFVHQFPTLQLRKKYEKLDCTEMNTAPTEFFNSGFLTASSRSRETLTQTVFQQVRDSVETISSVSEKGGGGGGGGGGMSQGELPPVLALPRRGQESRKGKTVVGTTSRLPSIHVDEYHKTTSGANEGSVTENKDQTPRGVAQGMGQLSLQSTPKKASESTPQPSTPLGMVQSKEERSNAELVSIPGLGGSDTSSLVIPGLGLETTPSTKASTLKMNKTTLEGGLNGSPLAPKLGSKTNQEESRRDSMMIDQTE